MDQAERRGRPIWMGTRGAAVPAPPTLPWASLTGPGPGPRSPAHGGGSDVAQPAQQVGATPLRVLAVPAGNRQDPEG
jgi:hypothetical protein